MSLISVFEIIVDVVATAGAMLFVGKTTIDKTTQEFTEPKEVIRKVSIPDPDNSFYTRSEYLNLPEDCIYVYETSKMNDGDVTFFKTHTYYKAVSDHGASTEYEPGLVNNSYGVVTRNSEGRYLAPSVITRNLRDMVKILNATGKTVYIPPFSLAAFSTRGLPYSVSARGLKGIRNAWILDDVFWKM